MSKTPEGDAAADSDEPATGVAMPNSDRLGNKILERLPEPDFERIVGQMETVSPDVGEVVALPGMEPKWVHFPVSGVLSSMVVLEDGSTVEASTVGNEGMDGLYLLADPLANPYRINVQVQGECSGCRRRRSSGR